MFISSLFSPFSGASIFLNGFSIGTQLYPTMTYGNSNFNPFTAALCMGQCCMKSSPETTTSGMVEVQARTVDVATANVVVAGADASSLAENSMLTLLGRL